MINFKKRFLIYGYGISGKSIEKYLINKKCNYNIYDDYKKINHKKVISKKYLLNNINEFSYFVVSPSIKIEKNHLLYNLKKRTFIDLDFLYQEITSQKIIGVTGTEGKSSTCNYIGDILSKKYNTKIIGNFGNTILDKKNLNHYISKIDILIIELSSYQLDKLNFLKLDYALITNIFSDHLDYHKTHRNYIISKFRIQKFLNKNSRLFLSKKLFLKYKNFIKINKNKIILHDEITPLKKNLSYFFKELNFNSIKKLIHKFDPKIKIENTKLNNLKYRNQLIYNSNNLKIYNDSKCTNLNNAIYKNNLINSSRKILILGGRMKKQNFKYKFNITNTLVLFFGNDCDLFLNHLNFINSNYFKFNHLKNLIDFIKLILVPINSYNYILFSPGGESYDFYKDYLDRGRHFNDLIKKVLL